MVTKTRKEKEEENKDCVRESTPYGNMKQMPAKGHPKEVSIVLHLEKGAGGQLTGESNVIPENIISSGFIHTHLIIKKEEVPRN